MDSVRHTTVAGLILVTCLASAAVAESRKEFRFTVGTSERANVSVSTRYGAITVKPGPAMHVTVLATIQDKAQVNHLQKGNRVDIETQLLSGADSQSGRVDYEVTVPPDVTLSVSSSTGPLTVEHLRGDLTAEGTSAPIEIRNSGGGHVHVKTMNGLITLADVHSAHVEITSISGDVHLTSVTGPLVQVNSGTGKIFFDGDFGSGGSYTFSTNSGDIDAVVPAGASADFHARSVQGEAENQLSLQSSPDSSVSHFGSSFVATVGKAASKVVFRSISGKIRLKRR